MEENRLLQTLAHAWVLNPLCSTNRNKSEPLSTDCRSRVVRVCFVIIGLQIFIKIAHGARDISPRSPNPKKQVFSGENALHFATWFGSCRFFTLLKMKGSVTPNGWFWAIFCDTLACHSEQSPAKIPLRLAEAEEVELGFKRALFRHTAGKFLVILVYNCKIFLCLTKNGFS